VASVRLYPVPVQGDEAPPAILSAIESANQHGWAETLIIGRGGGSLEDLMAFNDEAVARAVFASSIPVVSAVGHETDFSICDFIADLRAPTPSAAAELATPDQAVLKESFSRGRRQLQRRIQDRLQQSTQELDHINHRLQQRHPASRLAEQAKQLEALNTSLTRSMHRTSRDHSLKLDTLSRRLTVHRPDRKLAELSGRVAFLGKAIERLTDRAVRSRRELLGNLARTLNAVSPLETISRGYAVITSADTGDVISSVKQVEAGENVTARLKDGKLDCTVDTVN
jgi:exodeoxyribonuclease VII large subunit